jgi:hypothetical protein
VPKLLVSDKLRSYGSAFRRLRLSCRHEQGLRKITGRRIRIRQSDDASASCSGSSRLALPSASSACTVRFTTPSTFNGTSSPDPHCGSSEPKLPQGGKTPSRRHDAWRTLALNACSIGYRDKALSAPSISIQILRSTDGGQTWAAATSGLEAGPNSIALSADGMTALAWGTTASRAAPMVAKPGPNNRTRLP